MKYKKLKPVFPIALILLVILQCTAMEEPKGIELSVGFNEEFTIGDSEEDVILAAPSVVKTNSRGEIYIADGQTRSIKVFDANGDYQYEIGRSGQGPGEFAGTPFLDIDHEDMIHTLDGRNARATVFSSDGEVLKTFIPNKDEMIWPSNFKVLSSEEYLIFRKLPEVEDMKPGVESNILHLFDSKLSSRITSFGVLDSLMNTDNEFVNLYNTNISPGSFWVTAGKDILFVPEIYTGKIFRFKQLDRNNWVLEQVIESHLKPEEPVELMSGDSPPEEAIVFTVFSGGGPYAGVLNSQSLGIFGLGDGKILHLSSQRINEKWHATAELFEKDGSLIGVGKIETLSFTADQKNSAIKHVWKDQADRFYFIIEDGNAIVKVGEINFGSDN